jgi:hypothetical protein
MKSGFTLTYGPHLDNIRQGLELAGFEVEHWPAPIEQPKFMLNPKTGVRVEISYTLKWARWTAKVIWEV